MDAGRSSDMFESSCSDVEVMLEKMSLELDTSSDADDRGVISKP